MKRLESTVRSTVFLLAMLCLVLLGNGCSKQSYTLTIAVEGGGTTLPNPGNHNYEQNTIVALKMTPDAYNVFDHWAGKDCAAVSDANTIVMNRNRSITAVFTKLTHPVYIAVNPIGTGDVTREMVTEVGKDIFAHGQTVRLTATPTIAGYYFVNWSGDLTGPENPMEVLVTSEKSITANFAKASMEITAPPAATTAGQTMNINVTIKAGGRPIPNIVINLTEKTGQPFEGTKTVQTNAEGIAVFDNLVFYEGNYKLVFSSNNLNRIESDIFTVNLAGTGTAADPYLIHNLHGLMSIEGHLDKCFRIANDIDASATATSSYNSGKGWLPLGQKTTASFTGQIDGNNKTISNLYINRPDEEYVGFIGLITAAVQIKNLNLADVNIVGYNRVGGLVGEIKDVTAFLADNCSVTGTIAGSIFTGGMFGALRGSVTNCHTDTTIVAIIINDSSFNIGGLAGSAAEATITNCYTIGSITGKNTFGGLLGYAENCSISQCYTSADINSHPKTTPGRELGGFAGYLNGCYVTDCYSRGDVEGRYNLGGFCGHLNQSTIERCYSTGLVPFLLSNHGGFIGYRTTSDTSIITNCYYDSETSGCSDTGKGEPMTTAEMQDASNYVGWDFGAVWDISATINDGYPYLQ